MVLLITVLANQPFEEGWFAEQLTADQMFIYQGSYDSLGTVNEIAELVSHYNYFICTHGFLLNFNRWVNGSCLDVNYKQMPALLKKVRQLNPQIKIFSYVSATADHPNGCWPQPSIRMNECLNNECSDFKTWVDLWLNLEEQDNLISIDGIFIDLVHPALIGESVRDSVFSYVKAKNKLIMANALSDTLGLKFVFESPIITDNDFVFIEGYYLIAGSLNTQTESINKILKTGKLRWAALSTEFEYDSVNCSSDRLINAYNIFQENGGTAFCYQNYDLGTITGRWKYCSFGNSSTSVFATNPNTSLNDIVVFQNIPNPFNSSTTIKYLLTADSRVKIIVYNSIGQKIKILVDEYQSAGEKQVQYYGSALASGVYFYTVETKRNRIIKMMTLLK